MHCWNMSLPQAGGFLCISCWFNSNYLIFRWIIFWEDYSSQLYYKQSADVLVMMTEPVSQAISLPPDTHTAAFACRVFLTTYFKWQQFFLHQYGVTKARAFLYVHKLHHHDYTAAFLIQGFFRYSPCPIYKLQLKALKNCTASTAGFEQYSPQLWRSE